MQPLIHTIHGNLPVDSLTYSTKWDDQADYTKFTETYKQGDEVVRQSVHVMGKKPLEIGSIQQAF